MQSFWSDLRSSVRALAARPAYAMTAILMLALGTGSSTAIFTVVNSVLLRPLPYSDPDRLVQLWEISQRGSRMGVPEANFLDWKQAAHSFEGMAIFNGFTISVAGGSEPVRARVATVSRGFFEVMRVKPLLGSTPTPEPEAPPAVVVGYGFWQRVLGGNRNLEASRLTLSSRVFSVVGVLPPGFGFPSSTDLWVPREILGPVIPSRSAHNWRVIARLNPGIGPSAATTEIRALARRIHEQYADVTAVDVVAVPLRDQLTENVRPALQLLMGAVAILLLIACANVSSLLLAQSASRHKELAVRSALGASRWALIRLFVTQSLLLVSLGASLGVPMAALGVGWLLDLGSGTIPRLDEIRMDARVLGFAVLLSALVAVAVGAIPAIRASRSSLEEALRQAAHSTTSSTHHLRMRGLLVVSQVALTVILLVAAGLLAQSFVRILEVDLGFLRQERLSLEMLLPEAADDSDRRRLASSYQRAMERLAALPGITSVGGANSLPMSGSGANGRFTIEGGNDSRDYWPDYRVATPGYFEAMGIPLIRGRLFDNRDGASSPQVAVVSRSVAERVWPGEEPIGRRINYANMDGDETYMTIVGIVGDVRERGPDSAASGAVYVHYLQRGTSNMFTLVVHHSLPAATMIPRIKSVVQEIIPEASLRFRTLEEMSSAVLAGRRLNLVLLGAFGGTALLLALAGVYGLTAYSVAQRNREIGIRLALGARPVQLVGMFVRDGSILVLIGIFVGLAGSYAANRILSGLLYQISTTDPWTYAGVALPMLAASLLASYIPARSATEVDPMVTIQDN